MGSSRDIAIGPVAVVSLLLGTLLQNEIDDPVGNAAEYRRLAFTATFFAGITQVTLGFFRLMFPKEIKLSAFFHIAVFFGVSVSIISFC
jgi:high affinity sulfate transporter 1